MNETDSNKNLVKADWQKEQELRSKPWIDCSTEERIEKIRFELIEQRYTGRRVSTLENHMRTMQKHTHGPQMELVVPLQETLYSASLNGDACRVDPLA